MAEGTYITIAEVRRTCGIASTVISDDDVGDVIAESEKEIPKFFNTVFTPKEIIEVLNGSGTNRLKLLKAPLLAVRELTIDDTDVTPKYLNLYKSGIIELGNNSETPVFLQKSKAIKVKYVYGRMEDSSTSTSTTSAAESGSSVSLVVSSSTGIVATDWIKIIGMDGYEEVAQVSSVATGVVTVDKLVYDHESGSIVTKLQVNELFKKLMRIISSLALVARIVGESYDEITGYTIDEFHVQKGEPYTQWRETALQLIRERDLLMQKIMITPYFTS